MAEDLIKPTPELPDDTPLEQIRLPPRLANALADAGVKTAGGSTSQRPGLEVPAERGHEFGELHPERPWTAISCRCSSAERLYVLVVRISSNSERKFEKATGARLEARLADGGWVVFNTELKQVVSIEGRCRERLTEKAAREQADSLSRQ